MSRALGLEWPAALTLADGLAGLGPADELRALALSAALRAHLREAHGARWFADPRAGRLLRELWLEGGALEPEALASELERRGWTPARSPPSSPAPWAEWCPVVPAQAQRARPPSTTRRWPVTKPAPSDAKKLTAWATSSRVPMRPAGTEAR